MLVGCRDEQTDGQTDTEQEREGGGLIGLQAGPRDAIACVMRSAPRVSIHQAYTARPAAAAAAVVLVGAWWRSYPMRLKPGFHYTRVETGL